MPDAIQAEHVFKKFRRGQRRRRLRKPLTSWFRLNTEPKTSSKLQPGEFWALDDLSFHVRQGEALGIIGPNGAGKSTVLKLLAGIMQPTNGKISLQGRVSALIEVGAGFHPDLSGRENIFLNASILGMSRKEVRRKYDQIVDFAGIHDFLDTPIKRYSSGMYARLGFSVAAHVDPQILLVDEVLSVGDRVFRGRCMDKMRSFLKKGVAVVFVSHDLSAVSSFCDRALVLADGKAIFSGSADEAVAHYHDACMDKRTKPQTRSRKLVSVERMQLVKDDGSASRTFSPGETIRIEFDVHFHEDMPHPSFGLSLLRMTDRSLIFETSSTHLKMECRPAVRGSARRVHGRLRLNVPPGEYGVGCHVRDRDAQEYAAVREDEVRLMVLGEPISGGMVDLAPRAVVREVQKNSTKVQSTTMPIA